jgi:enoyl-CoA hydratase/carnithine racemase
MSVAEQQDVVLVEDVVGKNGGGVRVLTLHRPERLNAFNAAMIERLCATLEAAATDDAVHVVLITGTGRGFSVGADMDTMNDQASGEGKDAAVWEGQQRFDQLQALAEAYPKPLVAAVNGLAVGLGFTMLGYCDFVFLAASARCRTPFSQLGLSPEASSSYTFPLRMGWTHAARALMLGDWFTAQDVVDSGLGLEVVADERLMEVALAFAGRLAACPLQSLTATKRLMLKAHRLNLAEIRRLETESLTALVGTPANLAAIDAFMARRG